MKVSSEGCKIINRFPSKNWIQHHFLNSRPTFLLKRPPGIYQTIILPTRHLKVQPGARKTLKPKYKWDKVPATSTIVYESSLKNYIISLYVAVACGGIPVAAVLALRWQHMLEKLDWWDGAGLACVSSITLLALTLGYRFARTVIIRIYHDPASGQFLAVRRTCLGRLKQVIYYPQDVRVKTTGEKTIQNLQSFVDVVIHGQSYYLSADNFISPVYYNAHLGGEFGHGDLNKAFVSGPKF
ncbi:hypothetical protein PoB_003766600 [Plakobranchus ocellatus]|uniref:Transmembrane protein 186 n=1 Tax=Plakobranchus ocellatus TaxID=259542 RepID=A0AAV4AXB1_9GAST|nr:hypothetical protein PoB_003766600 [Plakobranchus ocellatus]